MVSAVVNQQSSMKKRDYYLSQHLSPFEKKGERGVKFFFKSAIKYIILLMVIFSCLIAIYFFLFSNKFQINSNTIIWQSMNSQQISAQEQSVFFDYLSSSKKRYIFVSPLNLFLFDFKSAELYLRNTFSLKNIQLKKKYPQTLNIVYELKQPLFVWQESEHYFLIDELGDAVREINPVTLKQDLPLISRATTTDVVVGSNLIKKETVNFVNELLEKIKRLNFNWRVTKIEFINNEVPTIIVKTNNNWLIYFSRNLEIDSQLIKLLRVLNSGSINHQTLQYIDLQVSNKVYWK